MGASSLYIPGLWPEPFAIRQSVSRLLLPFSVISAAARQQAIRRRQSAAIPDDGSTHIYVSATGDDGDEGTSIGTAVLTFDKAADLAGGRPSVTTIEVLGSGTWHETMFIPRANLTFLAGAGVVIDGDNTRDGINLNGCSNTTISGDFTIQNAGLDEYGIVGTGLSGIVIDGPRLQDCLRSGIYLVSCASPIVRNVYVQDIGRDGVEFILCSSTLAENVEGLRCTGRTVANHGSTNWIVRECYAHDGADTSVYGFECEMYGTQGGDDGLYVDTWAGVTTGIPLLYGFISKTSNRTRTQRCVAWGCRQSAINGAGYYFKGTTDCQLYHCDSYDNTSGVLIAWDNTSGLQSTAIAIRNSILSENTNGLQITQSSTGSADYDALYGNTTLAIIRGTTYASQAAYQAAGYEAHGVFADPDYVSTVYGGFALDAASPAIGAGGDLGEGAGLNLGHTGSVFGA